jgi:hypothetical protein
LLGPKYKGFPGLLEEIRSSAPNDFASDIESAKLAAARAHAILARVFLTGGINHWTWHIFSNIQRQESE